MPASVATCSKAQTRLHLSSSPMLPSRPSPCPSAKLFLASYLLHPRPPALSPTPRKGDYRMTHALTQVCAVCTRHISSRGRRTRSHTCWHVPTAPKQRCKQAGIDTRIPASAGVEAAKGTGAACRSPSSTKSLDCCAASASPAARTRQRMPGRVTRWENEGAPSGERRKISSWRVCGCMEFKCT